MQIVMGWPEWIVMFFMALSIWTRGVKITEYKTDKEKVSAGFGLLTYITLWPSLLYWGGFFS